MSTKSNNINELTDENSLRAEFQDAGLGKRLTFLREMARCTREEAANFARVKYSTYKAWENDRAKPAKTRAVWLINEFQARGINCSIEWVLTGKGDLPKRLNIAWDNNALVSEQADIASKADFTSEESKIQEEVEFFCRRYAHSIGFVVPDDGMLPTYSPGDVVAGIQQKGKQITSLIGCDCIVELKSGDRLLRNLQEGQQPHRYALLSINPNTASKRRIMCDVEITYAALVIWHRKKSKNAD